MMRLLKSALVVLLVCHTVSPLGTTPRFEDIFKNRCLDYNNIKAGSLLSTSDINCDDLWRNFSRPWIFQESCGPDVISYQGAVDLLTQTVPKNKALFWSGTMKFAHMLSNDGRRYVSLEDTLIGYAANGLNWCGQTTSPGINYTDCPPWGACPKDTVKNFWNDVSKWFASRANGEIQVVLNGSNPNRRAYRQGSVFRSVEVVNLRNELVTKLTAFVAHDLDKPRVEPCGTLSLLELKADLLAKNISFECIDNPPQVKHLLCVDSPTSIECNPSSIICADDHSGATGLIKADGKIERRAALLLALATSLFVKVFSN